MENNTNTSEEEMNSDTSEVKPSLKAILDSGNPSSSASPIKKETPDSCEEVADGGNDSSVSADENSFSYLKCDKDEPELKGPIMSHPQYEEYLQEFQDRYDFHRSLVKILDGYSEEIKKLTVDLEDAKARGDMDRYNEIGEQIKESCRRKRETNEKMKKIYGVLEAEMSSITQRMRDYVDAIDKTFAKH